MAMYNVLICDDQPDIVNALKIYLTPEGYQLYLSMVLGYPKVMPDHKAPRRENVETWL